MSSTRELVRSLQERIQPPSSRPQNDRVTSGCDALDRLLPESGFRRGTLVEWLGLPGCGATTLAMIAAREACHDGRALVVVDRVKRFYPPAATAYGINLENLFVARPISHQDFDWAMNQSFRSSAVAAVVCWPEKLESRAFRRWQLATEAGRSLGFLVRPASAAKQPSWADLRLLVQALPSLDRLRVKVELLRSRNGQGGRSVELELDYETHTLHLASQLAPTTSTCRSTGT